MLLQTSNLLICPFVELPFKNGIFEYPFIKSVKSDIRIWFLYIRIWYDIRILKLHLNIIIIFEYGNNMIIIFEYQIASDFQLCGKFYHEFVYISFEKKLFYIYNFL